MQASANMMDFASLQAQDNSAYAHGLEACVPGLEYTHNMNATTLPPPPQLSTFTLRPVVVAPTANSLQHLFSLEKLLLYERTNCYDFIPCALPKATYDIKDRGAEKIYLATEGGCKCGWNCCGCKLPRCGVYRDFDIHLTDNNGTEVLNAYREYPCIGGCCSDMRRRLHVHSPTGYVGQVFYKDPCCADSKMLIINSTGETILTAKYPCCDLTTSLCDDVEMNMDVLALDNEKIGSIKRITPSYCQGIIFKTSKYAVNFPVDLDVTAKALLLTAPFLLDLLLFKRR